MADVSPVELLILDAASSCVEEWGWSKVTIDDVCARAGVSRATLYRAFPGGRDVMFEALRVRELQEFFTMLRAHVEGSATLEDLLVGCITVGTTELKHDTQLASVMATAPGETMGDLTVAGLPRIVRVASEFFIPLIEQFVSHEEAVEIVEVLTRLVISFFVAPSTHFDFTDEASARHFVRAYLSHTSVDSTRSSN